MPTIDLATLTAAQGFTVQGDAPGDRAGYSVSQAGDVNGDGIDDVIIGAPFNADGGAGAGAAFVIYGKADRTRTMVDLTALSPGDGFKIQGDIDGFEVGGTASGAGDVNGDGIDDLVIGTGASFYIGQRSGAAYVIYGKASATRGTIDLATLAPGDGFAIGGAPDNSSMGRSIAGAGDINGDSIGDIVIGVPASDGGGSLAGDAYIIYGKAGATRTSVDLGTLVAADGFLIRGNETPGAAGYSVTGAGDFNNDGIDDFLIGAPEATFAGNRGEIFLIYGKPGVARPTLDLATFTQSDGINIGGGRGLSNGFSVAGLGDVNGDDFDDIIIGSGNLASVGEANVVYGRGGANTALINLATLTAADGYAIVNVTGSKQESVAAAGDVNGDGINDIIGFVAGVGSYIVYGEAGKTRGPVQISTLATGDGYRIAVPDTEVNSSIRTRGRVSGAGDVDGDGNDDLIVGTPLSDAGGTDAGRAYIVYTTDLFANNANRVTYDLSSRSVAEGFVIEGGEFDEGFGFSVAGAGDVNGDGIDDLIIGAPFAREPDGSTRGDAFVIYGKSGSRPVTFDLSTLSDNDGYRIKGQYDREGTTVSSGGDVNGDGIGDMIIGGGRSSAFVVYGKPGGNRGTLDLATLSPSDGYALEPGGTDSNANVAIAGDVNADGIDDMLISKAGGGAIFVVFGKTGNTRSALDLATLAPADGYTLIGGSPAEGTVSGAGDVNADGIADIVIGAQGSTDSAYLIYGKAGATRGTIDLSELSPSDGFVLRSQRVNDGYGASVSSAGDVNGDGIDDFIVGAFADDDGGFNSGSAFVIYGKAGTARPSIDLVNLGASDGFTIIGDLPNDFAGASVSRAGDVNGDGIDDLIIGASQRGRLNSLGASYVIFGKLGPTRGPIDLATLAPRDGFILKGDAAGDFSGTSVAGGDVNNDGVDDLIVGTSNARKAHIVYGKFDPFTPGDDTVVNQPDDRAYDGLGGFDRIDMSNVSAAITLNTATGTIISTQTGSDTVTNVEFFTLGSGDDIVTFGDSGFIVRSADGNDTVTGGTGRDLISGGNGNDILSGGTGVPNELGGGAGDDIYIVSVAGDSTVEAPNEGTDEVRTTIDIYALQANLENLTFTDNAAHAAGVGNGLNNVIIGGTGNDDLFGRDGNDTMRGGSGAANTLVGGLGDDTYFVDAAGDSVIETAGEGVDSVFTSLAVHVLRSDVENVTFSGSASAIGIGNELANMITGGAGDDFISGLDGDDVLTGGAGLDFLIGGGGADTFRINDTANPDRIFDFVSGVDRIALNAGAFARTATIDYVAGTAATSASSTFIYNSGNGQLFYDADGTGAGAAVAIAGVGGGATFIVGDFLFY